MIRNNYTYRLAIALLLCFVQAAGIVAYGQIRPRAAQKRAHQLTTDTLQQPVHIQHKDTLRPTAIRSLTDSALVVSADSLAIADSIAVENKKKMMELTASPQIKEPQTSTDSLSKEMKRKSWVPNPVRATWLALVIPGGGQIYNRKYWKLPIVYGGFMGCIYAITWNNRNYRDYSTAYNDIMNENVNDPSSWHSSWQDLVPSGGDPADYINNENFKTLIKNRKDYYRRFRDLSIIITVGVYALCMIDAYVDAQLFDFDITQDLSMRVEPVVTPQTRFSSRTYGVNCSFTF